MTWEEVKGNIYPFLIWTKQNQALLSMIVHRNFLDLSVGYVVRIEVSAWGNIAVKVTGHLLKEWKITETMLYEQAIENLKKEHYQIESLQEMLTETLGVFQEIPEEYNMKNLWVLTNEKMWYGAAAMLLGKSFFREVLGEKDYYIVPSSTHELILIPADGFGGLADMNQMVKQVNQEQVEVKDRLNDHVYYYNGVTGEIEIP